MEIVFEEFRDDLLRPDGSIYMSNVLHVRAIVPVPDGAMVFTSPVFVEAEMENAKDLIAGVMQQQVNSLNLN